MKQSISLENMASLEEESIEQEPEFVVVKPQKPIKRIPLHQKGKVMTF